MPTAHIALATAPDWADLTPDDLLLVDALAERGILATPALWDSPAEDWKRYDGVLIRSCWDYSWRLAEFLLWLDRLESDEVRVWNPAEVVRQNVSKRYLRRLEAAGLAIPPTVWLDEGEPLDLATLLSVKGWNEVVVKPVVSAGARETFRLTADRASEFQPRLAALAAEESMMIQPFLPEICSEGEWSLLFFEGRFSHAVVKRPAPGDFRIQVQYGGTAVLTDPPAQVLADAEQALQLLGRECLYARLDGILSEGRFLFMEVELIEPRLFLAEAPGSAARLAEAVVRALHLG